jgi:hypothetical protein
LLDKGLLPVSLDDYLTLLDWTGRQIPKDKKRSISSKLAPILQRLQINVDNRLETISEFDSRFTHVVGRVVDVQIPSATGPVPASRTAERFTRV